MDIERNVKYFIKQNNYINFSVRKVCIPAYHSTLCQWLKSADIVIVIYKKFLNTGSYTETFSFHRILHGPIATVYCNYLCSINAIKPYSIIMSEII